MPRKPRITVTSDRSEIFVRKNGVLKGRAVRHKGMWQCFWVFGGNGPAPTVEYQGSIFGKQKAANFLVELVA